MSILNYKVCQGRDRQRQIARQPKLKADFGKYSRYQKEVQPLRATEILISRPLPPPLALSAQGETLSGPGGEDAQPLAPA